MLIKSHNFWGQLEKLQEQDQMSARNILHLGEVRVRACVDHVKWTNISDSHKQLLE